MLTAQNRYVDPSSATTYSNNNDIQFHQAKDFMDTYGNLLVGPVLDIGSGDGKFTAHIAKAIGQPVTGVDISTERVEFANQHYRTDKVSFYVADAVRLDEQKEIASTSYKTIISVNSLHHIPSTLQLTAFQKAKKLLELNNGAILFLIPGRSPELHDSINEAANNDTWKKYFTTFDLSKVRTYESPKYYAKLCDQAGFYGWEVSSSYEKGGKELDTTGVKKFLSGWLPHLAYLKSQKVDESIQNKFLDDIVRIYFMRMKKDIHETIEPKVTQNRIVAYANQAAFFNRHKRKTDSTPPINPTTRLSSSL
jgi:SAM-dependent methyltransferase